MFVKQLVISYILFWLLEGDVMQNVVVIKGVLESIKEWLKEELNDMWRIKVDKDRNSVSAEYEDGYNIERVDIEVTVNEHNIVRYTLYAETASIDDEIIHCDSCHDCAGEECWIWEQFYDPEQEMVDTHKLDEHISKEVEQWLSTKPIRYKMWSEELKITPTIVERECYVNVSHTHIYKGVALTFETQDFDRLKAVFKMRDVLYHLIG